MKVSKKAAARAALVVGLEAQIAALTIASQPTYGKSYWVEHRSALAVAKEQLAAVAANEVEIEAARMARLAAAAAAKAERAALHARRVTTKGPRESLVCIKTALARKAKAVAQAKAWVETLNYRADAFAFAAQGDQDSFGQAAEMAAARRNRAEKDLEALMATSAMAFWK